MEAAGERNFSVSMTTSSSAPFQEERLGLCLSYPGGGGVHGKLKRGCSSNFWGLKFWQILFSWAWMSETGPIFLGYVKLRLQEQFFTRYCNVTFRNYCVVIGRKNCNTATPVHSAMAKFSDR